MALDPIAFAQGFKYSAVFPGDGGTAEAYLTSIFHGGTVARPVTCWCSQNRIAAVGCNGPADTVAVLFVCGHIDNNAQLSAQGVVDRANSGDFSGPRWY